MGASVRYIDANETFSEDHGLETVMRPGTGFAALFRDIPLLFLDAPGTCDAGPPLEDREQRDRLQVEVGDLGQFVATAREQPVNFQSKAS